jgi:uncharacterized repeat protein (TIGR02543 family)
MPIKAHIAFIEVLLQYRKGLLLFKLEPDFEECPVKRLATLLAAVLMLSMFSPVAQSASAAPTMTQQNEPGQVAVNGDGNFRGRNDVYQLVAPSVGNWDLVGAWNFNNSHSSTSANGSYATNNCADANNNTGSWGPTDNNWGALQFNAISNYGTGVSANLRTRAGVDTGINLSTSINSINASGCTTVFSFTDYYGGPYTNSFAQVRRTTETLNSVSYVYPESYFRVSEATGATWSNTFSNLDPNKKYRFQFVYSALNVLNERIVSKSSVAGGAEATISEDVSAAITSSRHKNRISVMVTGADSYTLSRTNLTGTTAMVLNAFTIYEERKTATATSLAVSDTAPGFGASVTLSASVTPAATGTVSFFDGTNALLCTTATLISGEGLCSWTPASPGVSTVRAVYAGDATYASSTSATSNVIAGKAPSTTLITCSTRAYSGVAHEPCTASVTGAGGLNTTATVTYQNNTSAGTATANAQYAGGATHEASTATPVTFAISKALPTFTWNGMTKTYGDSAFAITAPTPSVAGTFTYSSSAISVVSLSGTTATINSSGTSVITATFTPSDSANYESGLTTNMTVTINKASVTVTASSPNVSYGSNAPTISPIYSAFVASDTSSVVSGVTCSASSYTTTTNVGTNVATTCSGAVATDYQFVYVAGSMSVVRAVMPNDLQITSLSGTYGTNLTLVTTGGLGDGAIQYRVISGNCALSPSGLQLISSANGTCVVVADKLAGSNYESLSSAQTSITFARKNLTITGLTGVNKEFNGNRMSAIATGVPQLAGLVGNDVVTLTGTPVFEFASSDASTGISVQASGYQLTNIDADKYTLTQPSVQADITRRASVITAANVSVGRGVTVVPSSSATGLIAPDQLASATYRFSTGTGTPPTAAGISSITPSLAVLSPGVAANYTFSYVAGTLEILGEFTITLNPNRGSVSPASLSYQVGAAGVGLPLPSRANYQFDGWFDETVTPQVLISRNAYQPDQDKNLVAHWTQLSLVNLNNPTIFGSIRATTGLDGGMSATRSGTRVEIDYFANTLPDGTQINAYLQGSTTSASQVLTGEDNLLLSVVLAWVAPDGTVPDISNSDAAIRLKIINASIKTGAKVYSILGLQSQLLGTATADGWVILEIRVDPEIVIANPAEVSIQEIISPPVREPQPVVTIPIEVVVPPVIDNSAAEEAARRLAEEKLRIDKLAADAATKLAAILISGTPNLTVYSMTANWKLTAASKRNLAGFAKSLPAKSAVTCVGYIYKTAPASKSARTTALNQAKSLCTQLKLIRKDLVTSVAIKVSSQAPRAAVGATWVVGSFRADSYKK